MVATIMEKSGGGTFFLVFEEERREGLAGDYSGRQHVSNLRNNISGGKEAHTLSAFGCTSSSAFFDFCNRFPLRSAGVVANVRFPN
jgi:hypothetical protein